MPGVIALVRSGLLGFVGIVAVLHLLRPDLAPADRFVSEYARGWSQPLQVLAFLSWALATGALAVLAARAPRRPFARDDKQH